MKNFFTGSVFQFYVPEIRMYSFCKFFDFRNLSSFHGLLAQVFNKFSEKEDNSLEDLKDCDWLFGARSMHKWPDLRKNSKWKSLGILINPADSIIPDFKGTNSIVQEDESSIKKWYLIRNFTSAGECSYEQVNHLERITLTTASLGLVRRTGMEYCRINGIDIKKNYDLQDEGIRNMYFQMINTPIYNTISLEQRGKGLCGNVSK